MSSKIARPPGGQQQDQKKIYLDWANHYLRKAGQTLVLNDLKDISDGYYLPQVIQAVVIGDIPGVHQTASTDDERRENIQACVKYLQGVGVSCTSFKAKDIADGHMRAILSLFYNLSQFKKNIKTGSTSSTGSDSRKITPPVSSGLKSTLGMANGAPPSTSVPKSSTLTPVVANGNVTSPAVGRRTAGSSIMTTTTYDKPYSQRRIPYKPLIIGEGGEKPILVDSENEPASDKEPTTDKPVVNGFHTDTEHHAASSRASDNEPKSHSDTTDPKSQTVPKKSKFGRPGSFAYQSSTTSLGTGKESRLHQLTSTQSTSQLKGSHDSDGESKDQQRHVTPTRTDGENKDQRHIPSFSRSKSIPRTGGSKLHSSPSFVRKNMKQVGGGEVPSESETNEVKPEEIARPQSRLKFPGSGGHSTPSHSGRSTPSALSKSSIQRPSSRLSKPGFTSEKSGHSEEASSKTSSESKLKLQRKGSDGAIKRHRVNNTVTSLPGAGDIEPGSSSSLPRHLPRGVTKNGSGLSTPEAQRKHPAMDKHSSEQELASGSDNSASSAANEGGTVRSPPTQGGVGSSLKKPIGGLRKPGGGFGFGVRTPNLTSGSQATPTTTDERGVADRASLSQSGGAKEISSTKHEGDTEQKSGSQTAVARSATFSGAGGSKLSRFAGRSKLIPNHTPLTSQSTPHPSQHTPHLSQPNNTEPPQPSGSTSSVDSSDIQIVNSEKIDSQSSKVIDEHVKPDRLEIPNSQSSTSEIISPPAGFKSIVKDDGTHPRYGRRISPEGMSHEEATSPRDVTGDVTKESTENVEDLNRKNEEITEITEPVVVQDEQLTGGDPNIVAPNPGTKTGNATRTNKLGFNQPETGQSEALDSPHLLQKQGQRSTAKAELGSSMSILVRKPSDEDRRGFSQSEVSNPIARVSRFAELPRSTSQAKQRARSLSPKASHRIQPSRGHTFVPVHHEPATVFGSSEDVIPTGGGPSPLKSSMRNRGRKSSSSSVDSSSSSSPSRAKVTISPRSSQLVYDPDTTGLHPPGFRGNHQIPKMLDRPVSYMESSATRSLSPNTSNVGVYHSQQLDSDLSRHTSVRSTFSERLDYQHEQEFLERGLVPNDKGSNPEFELLETFETQLSTMKKDLANKDRMLSMYETSMADLSSKVHYLKKTLDEKDREIRQLTDEKGVTLSPWFDLEGRSLASRAASEAGVLSDGCLSDSAMEPGSKAAKKKKKSWKRFSFRKSKKDGLSSKDHLSPNMDTESVISGRSTRSIRRTLSSKRKTPDLMSISEYITTDPRFRDPDTKSNYTLDARSEFAIGLPMIWADEVITVYDDENPGAKVKVFLQPELAEDVIAVNDSGFYGNGLSRHSSNNSSIHKRDSIGSRSDDSSHHGDEHNQIVLGTLSVAPETSWVTIDTKIGNIFMHHLNAIDQEGYLGLSEDSVFCYFIGEQRRAIGNALLPPLTPYQAIADNNIIKIVLRGAAQASCDSLAYKTLMCAETLKSYMNMLQDTHWLVVMGTKGTCKTSLASGLSRHLSLVVSSEECEDVEDVIGGVGGEIVSFNLDKEGIETPLKYINNDLVKRTQLNLQPPILLLEDIYECKDLEQILVAASTLHKRPYIIAALCSGTTKGIPLHQLLFHHQIRVVTCNPSSEPVVGILARTLRKQIYQLKACASDLNQIAERMVNWLPYLLDHLNQFINKFHSNVVNLGPRVFMGCPLNQSANELEAWFLNLWNYFIIPYLMGTIMAGIETYTADPQLEWMDVREWVVETYPWQPSMGVNKLRTLTPDDVGWNHAVRPQQNRLMLLKDDDTRSLIHA